MVDEIKAMDADVAETPAKATEKHDEKISAIPPLDAAAQRLDRLLGGGNVADTDRSVDFYANPVKVVRRWLGTSSGAAKAATAEDIKAAATKLLDPNGPCSAGRALLISASVGPEAMDADDDKPATSTTFLSRASVREVESWLISLLIRLLWKEEKFSEAFELSQKGIAIIMSHLEEASLRITSASAGSASSLFPLLARIFRLRSLVTESLNISGAGVGLRADMAKAHNMASLRRDVDSQATLLNCMLRDLLLHSQGTHFMTCFI